MPGKIHSTNYNNAFIAVADDCPALAGTIPPLKAGEKTIAGMQYEIIIKHPYQFTSDDVIFEIFAQRNNLSKSELENARTAFFSKGQPCFRSSPLTKRYGWGIHSNEEGKVALYGCESKEYKQFIKNKKLEVVKAMKSSR